MAARRNSDTAAISKLRAKGYRVKRPDDYVKRGLEVHREVYAEFTDIRCNLGMRAYEALCEALSDWIKKHKP